MRRNGCHIASNQLQYRKQKVLSSLHEPLQTYKEQRQQCFEVESNRNEEINSEMPFTPSHLGWVNPALAHRINPLLVASVKGPNLN